MRLAQRELLESELRQRRVAEHGQGGGKSRGSRRRGGGVRLCDDLLEPHRVDLVLREEPEQVAGRPRLDPLGPESLPQRRHVSAQSRLGGLGRARAPERLDQLVARDDLIRAQHEQREKRALLRPRRSDVDPVGVDLECPQ